MFDFLRRNVSARLARRLSLGSLTAAALVVSACAPDSVVAPEPVAPASQNLVGTLTGTLTGTVDAVTKTVSGLLTPTTALTWNTTVTETTVSKTIGVEGGTLSAPGLTLEIPRGAVSANTTFKITRLAGKVVAYDFAPHGARFAKPLVITQSTAGTNFRGFPGSTLVRGAYFPDRSLIDQLTSIVRVLEFRTATVAKDKSTVKFTVDHFSGYLVSMD